MPENKFRINVDRTIGRIYSLRRLAPLCPMFGNEYSVLHLSKKKKIFHSERDHFHEGKWVHGIVGL